MAGLLVPVDSRFRGNDGVGLPSIFIAMTVGALGWASGWRAESAGGIRTPEPGIEQVAQRVAEHVDPVNHDS